MSKLVATVMCSASLLLGGVVGDVRTARAQKLTDITFSLDFIVLGRHAPLFVAIEKGFYKEEGLNVTMIPAKGTAAAIQNVESKVAQLGFIDVPSLVIARAGGSTVKVVSVIYQKSPFTIFSLDPGANVTTLKDLEGLTVGSHSGSFISNIVKALMRKNGLDPNKLEVTNIEPSARVAMLVARKVPSVDFYIMTKPGIERAAEGAKVRTLLLSDFGLDLYSNGIGATEAFLKENPDAVKKFVRATLRGYQHAFKHPAEAAALQRRTAKALQDDITVEELKIVEDLTVTPDVRKNGLGWFSPDKMKSSVEWVVENGGFPKENAPKLEDVYATGFLPERPIMPE
jgi:NitT/TauT family transport system substrate-binding protein